MAPDGAVALASEQAHVHAGAFPILDDTFVLTGRVQTPIPVMPRTDDLENEVVHGHVHAESAHTATVHRVRVQGEKEKLLSHRDVPLVALPNEEQRLLRVDVYLWARLRRPHKLPVYKAFDVHGPSALECREMLLQKGIARGRMAKLARIVHQGFDALLGPDPDAPDLPDRLHGGEVFRPAHHDAPFFAAGHDAALKAPLRLLIAHELCHVTIQRRRLIQAVHHGAAIDDQPSVNQFGRCVVRSLERRRLLQWR
mmetsp:Transcript_32414/g.73248  ORF Transcript_32414/g.73248 Transcript_32414/m.73248 type:complete len:254 (-) Transcript_32414:681-1442(-)